MTPRYKLCLVLIAAIIATMSVYRIHLSGAWEKRPAFAAACLDGTAPFPYSSRLLWPWLLGDAGASKAASVFVVAFLITATLLAWLAATRDLAGTMLLALCFTHLQAQSWVPEHDLGLCLACALAALLVHPT